MSTSAQPASKKLTPEEIQQRIAEATERKKARSQRHIYPDPAGINVTPQQRKEAMEHLYGQDSILIRYTRTKPQAHQYIDKNGKPAISINRGDITGAVVAFVSNGKLVIGWSKRISATDDFGNPIETLDSTKKRATYVAILRGLVDTVTLVSKGLGETADGSIIPTSIVREMPSFISRAERYFKKDPVNVV